MESVYLILLVVLVNASAVEEKNLLQQWNKFQERFGKTYRSPLEARKRFSIFQKNLELIETHNNLFEQNLETYTMGINQFADWTDSEFQQYVNMGRVNETLKGEKVFIKTTDFVAPESIDWRERGVVTPVKDQGSCGGSWAFSATGALEGLLGKANNTLVSLSEQYLIDCSTEPKNNGCGGGWMSEAFEHVKNYGIDSEADYPYEGVNGKCRASEHQSVMSIFSYVDKVKRGEDHLIEAIATKGPVSIGIDASSELKLYSGGIFSGYCANYLWSHPALAVGYGTENGKEFYIIKNSWGTSWGEEGYIRLPKNSDNKCCVSCRITYPELQIRTHTLFDNLK